MKPTLLNDRYRIIDVLSSGGFCKTFLAEDTQMPSVRRCVIKQLKPITNNPEVTRVVQRRFQREAAILEELGGASNQIPALYAYFQQADQFYLVQEWIPGQTLNQIIQQNGCMSESEVHSILISLLNLLEYLHGKGIIHRDIKPNNIILRNPPTGGLPVLIDFGAVRETMATVVNNGIVTSSIIIGTPGFMPNEQVAGRPVFASDLYSLGLTAIYLLTGKLPQELATDSYTGEIIWERDTISPNMFAVLHKATRLNISERYKSAKAMQDALQRITNLIPASTPTFIHPQTQIPAIESAAQSRKQNGIFLGGSLIAGGLVGALIIISLLLTKSPQPITYKNSSSLLSPQSQSPPSETTSPQIVPNELAITNSANLPSSFHFIADSTESNLQSAVQQIKRLQAVGYRQPGVFWIPDYPNLSSEQLFVVYVATFSDRNSCIDFLKTYGQVNSSAYCAFASTDPNAPPDRFYFKQVSTISKLSGVSPIIMKIL